MTQENTALLEALANIQEELALTLEELIDHNGDSMDDARRKRIDQLRARHWSDCAVYNEPHAPSGPCDCGGYLVSITTPTPAQVEPLLAELIGIRNTIAEAIWRDIGGERLKRVNFAPSAIHRIDKLIADAMQGNPPAAGDSEAGRLREAAFVAFAMRCSAQNPAAIGSAKNEAIQLLERFNIEPRDDGLFYHDIADDERDARAALAGSEGGR